MSRYDSHLIRLQRKIEEIEGQLLARDFPKILREHAETGQLPKNKTLRDEVIKWKTMVEQMLDTLPQKLIMEEKKDD